MRRIHLTHFDAWPMNKPRQAEIIRLYDDASPELQRLLRRKLGNRQEAEEITQDAFAKLCELVEREDIKDLRKYFFTMANRQAVDVLRRRKVQQDHLRERAGDGTAPVDAHFGGSPEVAAIQAQKLALAKQALRGLPAKTRHVFLLHRFQGYTYQDIAGLLGLSRKAVEYHMSRALSAVLSAVQEA